MNITIKWKIYIILGVALLVTVFVLTSPRYYERQNASASPLSGAIKDDASKKIELFGFVTELLGDGVVRVTMPPSEATEYREVFAVPSDVVEVDGVKISASTVGLGLGDFIAVVGYIVPGSAAQYGGVPLLRIDALAGPYHGVTKLNQPE